MILLENDTRATLDDLHSVDGKAELLGGRIVRFMSTGLLHGRVAREILLALCEFVGKSSLRGEVLADNVGFEVPELASGRESFSPDVAYYDGPVQDDVMDFVKGPPTLAVEIRSKDGYGPKAEREIAAKRADYFEAGTQIVWDVDVKAQCINAYSNSSPNVKRVFSLADLADAEPLIPGWQIAVADIFKK